MVEKKVKNINRAELRRLAEEHIKEVEPTKTKIKPSKDEALRLLHELNVHQIELEMQNTELRQTRDKAEALLEKYTDLYDFAPVGYVTLDRKGTVRSVNFTGAGLLGIERSRLKGRRFEHFVANAGRPVFAAFLEKVFASRTKEACEVALLKEGNFPLFVQIEAVADASGEECRLVLTDIIESKQMGELRQREAQFRSVVENQTEIICRTKEDGTITFVNDVYCRVFGKTRNELLGSTWYPEVFPDDLAMVKEQLRTLAPSNQVVVVEKRVYTCSGAIRWMQFVNRGFFDNEGRLVEIQAVGRDITERKEVEDALRTSDERLNLALTASKMGVWAWNVQNGDLYWSPEVFEIFGIERCNVIFETFTNLLHPDDADRLMAAARQTLAENTPFTMEYRIIRSDGQVRWVSDHACPIYDDKGIPLRLTGTVHDITERKLAEAEVNKLNADLAARTAELERSNQDLTAFNYMSSHDLCRPLNNIFTSAQAIELQCGNMLDEECKGLLKIIVKGSRHMSNLIGMFLRFSQADHVEMHRQMVNLSDMAKVVTAGLRLAEPGRRVEFKIEEGLMVNCDPEFLRVVLENLFNNAWKFTGNREQATIELGETEIDGRRTCFIRDNGVGFDMQEAEGLFLPFKRLPGSDKFAGHGIGLATVERIIRRHGGKIWALGEPGNGATFFFTLGV